MGRVKRKRGDGKPSPVTWATAHCEATSTGWHCVIPTPLSANRIWRNGRGRTYEAKQHGSDKSEAVKRWGKSAKVYGDVALRIVWVRPARRGDLDNFAVKPVLDILKGVFFDDDSQVAELQVLRVDDATRAPGVYVWIFPADEPKVEAA
ncbi:endodeoxyribonuclease rusA [Caudoviricetes sp.]|nr:endodeoxyribonuclease rusA [Caudoviricetes sp.]